MAKYVTNPHEKYYFATQIFIMSRRNRRNRRNFYDHGLFGLNGWADAEGSLRVCGNLSVLSVL